MLLLFLLMQALEDSVFQVSCRGWHIWQWVSGNPLCSLQQWALLGMLFSCGVGCGAGGFSMHLHHQQPCSNFDALSQPQIKQFDEKKQKASAWLPLKPLLGCKEGSPAIQIPFTRGLAKQDGVFMKAKTAWTIHICISKAFVEAVSREQQVFPEYLWRNQMTHKQLFCFPDCGTGY